MIEPLDPHPRHDRAAWHGVCLAAVALFLLMAIGTIDAMLAGRL